MRFNERLLKFIDTTKKPVYCKSCFKEIKTSYFRNSVELEPFLCDECLSKINPKIVIRKIENIKVMTLSTYDGIMKQWLIDYKEKGDVELAPCLLFLFFPLLRMISKTHLLVPCPSSQKKIEERGFDHLPLMLESGNIPYRILLEKKSELNQKEQNMGSRFKEKGIVRKESEVQITNKVCLFDDVLTTGATLKESARALIDSGINVDMAVVLLWNKSTDNLKLK